MIFEMKRDPSLDALLDLDGQVLVVDPATNTGSGLWSGKSRRPNPNRTALTTRCRSMVRAENA